MRVTRSTYSTSDRTSGALPGVRLDSLLTCFNQLISKTSQDINRNTRGRNPSKEDAVGTWEYEVGGAFFIVSKMEPPTQLAAFLAYSNWPISSSFNILEF